MPAELRIRVLLSIQRALWFEVYPSIRAIYVGFDLINNLKPMPSAWQAPAWRYSKCSDYSKK